MKIAYVISKKDVLDRFLKLLVRLVGENEGFNFYQDTAHMMLQKNGSIVVYRIILKEGEDASLSTFEDYEKKLSSECFGELIEVYLRGKKLCFSKSKDGSNYPKQQDAKDIRPNYYKQNGHDLFDHFTEIMPTQGFRGFMIGNIFKYVTRYPAKNGIEDLHKARTYLDRLIEFEESQEGKANETTRFNG